MGTRDMDSTPPATTTSYCPAINPAAAECTDCWDEPHWRSMVKPGTLSGHPAARTAVRAMHAACSWAWDTHPQMTSSTIAGSIPLRSASAWSTCADRFVGGTPDSPPLPLPPGLRTAPTIPASPMSPPSVDGPGSGGCHTDPPGGGDDPAVEHRIGDDVRHQRG